MKFKEKILEILENNSEWLSDNDVVLKSDYSKVADEIVKLLNLHSVSNNEALESSSDGVAVNCRSCKAYGVPKRVIEDCSECVAYSMYKAID
jgi:hypothetical protein